MNIKVKFELYCKLLQTRLVPFYMGLVSTIRSDPSNRTLFNWELGMEGPEKLPLLAEKN
jgi:hypothetical protein